VLGVRLELPGRERDAREREHHLPRGGGVRDARAPQLRDALHRARAANEVDGHCVPRSGQRERRRLAGLLDEALEHGSCEGAEIEPVERCGAELHEPDPESIPAALRLLHVPRVGERREQPRRGARVHADAACELVRPELAVGGERGEQDGGSRDRSDPARATFPSARLHGTLDPINMATVLPRRQQT
jgi:hypothetical protein